MRSFLFSVVLCCISLSLAAQISKTINLTSGGVLAALTAHEKNSVQTLLLLKPSMLLILRPCAKSCPNWQFSTSEKQRLPHIPESEEGVGHEAYPIRQKRYLFSAFYTTQGSKLTTVMLNSQTTTIWVDAFNRCPLLTSINFPSKLVTISKGAFSGCNSPDSINLPTNRIQPLNRQVIWWKRLWKE